MTTEKYKRYAYMTVSYAGVFFLIYLFFRYALRAVLPFLLGFSLVIILAPLCRYLSKKAGGSEKCWRVLLSLLSLTLLSLLLFFLGRALFLQAMRFLKTFAEPEKLDSIFCFFCHPFGTSSGNHEGFDEMIAKIEGSIADASSELLKKATLFLTDWMSEIPRLLLFVPVVFLATAYFASDYEKIKEKMKAKCQGKVWETISAISDTVKETVFPYCFAYVKLMLLTFAFMAIGLWVLKVESPLFLALIIALLDVLPVIGVGTILVPWGIYAVFFANRSLGIGLLVLFLLHELMRQFAEPRIVGRGLGIHPLLSLVFLYAGYSLFGILGIFLLPLFGIIVKTAVSLRHPAKK